MKRFKVPGTGVSLLSFPGKLDCPAVNMPPKVTCHGGQCATYCYAQKHRFKMKPVIDAMMARYNWTKECLKRDCGKPYSRDEWLKTMTAAIRPYSRFRIHGAGDFFGYDYTVLWYTVCIELPNTKFWINTRAWRDPKILMVLQSMANLPNVTVRPSSDPGAFAWVIDGLHAGAAIEYEGGEGERVFKCPASKGKSCDGCVACWDRKYDIISYKMI